MTIHRALSELKLIDSKIEKQISELLPTGTYQKNKLIIGYIKEEDFTTSATSKFQSVTDLINRKSAIKSAIVQANGATKLKLGGKEMTIADAINFKSAIKFKKQLIDRLKNVRNASIADMNNNNAIVEQNVQKLLEYTFGKENVKVDPKDMEAVRKPYIEANEFHLFDPLKVNEKIEAMEKEVGDFEMEVDAALSEINAVTFIEV